MMLSMKHMLRRRSMIAQLRCYHCTQSQTSPLSKESSSLRRFSSSSSSTTQSTLREEDFATLHSIRVAAQRVYAGRPFLGTKNLATNEFEYITYDDFGRKVDRLARVLVYDRNVKHGDKIAVISKNREEWAVAGIFFLFLCDSKKPH